jgi:hypothetical protein
MVHLRVRIQGLDTRADALRARADSCRAMRHPTPGHSRPKLTAPRNCRLAFRQSMPLPRPRNTSQLGGEAAHCVRGIVQGGQCSEDGGGRGGWAALVDIADNCPEEKINSQWARGIYES